MALTKDQEDYVINKMEIDNLEKQIEAKQTILDTFKIIKQTEIDDEQTKINGEIQVLQSQIEALK